MANNDTKHHRSDRRDDNMNIHRHASGAGRDLSVMDRGESASQSRKSYNAGNFANDRERARAAGKKGGEAHGGSHRARTEDDDRTSDVDDLG